MAEQSQFRHSPRLLSQSLYEQAKSWWGSSILVKFLAFFIGLISVFFTPNPQSPQAFENILLRMIPVAVGIASITSELLQIQSDRLKGKAEALGRKLDMFDSFGWKISPIEISDLLVSVPQKLRKKFADLNFQDTFFASTAKPGSTRALENLQESAWWSKHLTERAFHLSLGTFITVISLAILAVIFSVLTANSIDTPTAIARVATAVIVLAFSIGSLRTSLGYYNFSRRASDIEQIARRLQETPQTNTEQAVKAWHEYHLARSTSPLIPTLLYSSMRNTLNEMWNQYHPSENNHPAE